MTTTATTAPFLDNITFKKRNPLIVRSFCLFCAIIVYGVMSIEAWQWTYNAGNDHGPKTKRCLFGEDSEGICTFGIFVSFCAFLAAITFLGGEILIEKTSMIIYRKQYYFTDLAFSGCWTLLFLINFFVLDSEWNHTEGNEMSEIEKAGASGAIRAAIWFSFLSVPLWGASTYMALQRYRVMKAEAAYASDVFGARRPSAYPSTIQMPPTSTGFPSNPPGSSTVNF